MTEYAWPFLISRSRRHDYRPVVAPDFLVHKKAAGILAEHVGGDPGAPPRMVRIRSPAGPLSLYYRVVPALQNGDSLKDGYGRDVVMIEGVVTRGRAPATLDASLLDHAHAALAPAFSEFWESDSPLPVKSAQPLRIEGNSRPQPDPAWLTGAAVATVLALALWGHARSEARENRTFRVQIDSLRAAVAQLRTNRLPDRQGGNDIQRRVDSLQARLDRFENRNRPASLPTVPADTARGIQPAPGAGGRQAPPPQAQPVQPPRP